MSLENLQKLAQATGKVGIGRERLKAGIYDLAVKDVTTKSSDKNKHTLIIASLKVIAAAKGEGGGEPTPVDAERSVVFDMDNEYGYGINEFANFVAAIAGEPVLGQKLVDTAKDFIANKTPRGVVVKAEVTTKDNPKDPTDPFTKVRFGAANSEQNTDAAILARRQSLGG